jgi:dienelactone hydrolase
MNRSLMSFTLGLTMLASLGANAAPRSQPTPEELRPRLDVTSDSVQNLLEEIGVTGWSLHAGLSLAASAQPDLDRLRAALDASVAAYKAHRGSYTAAVNARRTLDEHQQAVLTEIGVLLTPAQRASLQKAPPTS